MDEKRTEVSQLYLGALERTSDISEAMRASVSFSSGPKMESAARSRRADYSAHKSRQKDENSPKPHIDLNVSTCIYTA